MWMSFLSCVLVLLTAIASYAQEGSWKGYAILGTGHLTAVYSDDTRIFKAQHEFLRQTDIMHAMVGMLSAIPKTPGCHWVNIPPFV